MDIDLPLSDAIYYYSPQPLQTVTQSLPGATSTAVVDYAATLGNPPAVQIAAAPSYNIATVDSTYETTFYPFQHTSLSGSSPQSMELTGTSYPAPQAHLAERSPREQPKIDIPVATTNTRGRRKPRMRKFERDMIKKEGRAFADGLNVTTQTGVRGERNFQMQNGNHIVSGDSQPDISIQDCFNQLTVNENNHPGHSLARGDRSDYLSQTITTIPFKVEQPILGFGSTGRSDITATSSQMNNTGRKYSGDPMQFADSASWASLMAQALKNRAKIGKAAEQPRAGKKKARQPRNLPMRLAELEKQLTTFRRSGPSSITLEKKITHITRQALHVRVRIEEDAGRLTAPEAKELRKANTRMLCRKTKKTDHERGVENLVDQVAMLL